MIADGKHAARLYDLVPFVTKEEKQAVSFIWDCNGARVTSVLTLLDRRGNRNTFGIQVTKRWATDWDGQDLAWFKENRDALLGSNAVIMTTGGEVVWVNPAPCVKGKADESKCDDEPKSKVEVEERNSATCATTSLTSGEDAASPFSGQHNAGDLCQPQPSTSTSAKTIHIKLVVDLTKLDDLPSDIEPNFMNAKTLFDLVTQGTDRLDADKVWTLMAKKIGPMQIDFGESEWAKMIEQIKQLKSWSGEVVG